MKRWAVFGGGGIAPAHLRALQRLPNVEVVGVAEIRQAARDSISQRFGIPTFDSMRSLLDKTHPDAVTIALPPSAHMEGVRAAAERGVHVLCEKPLAETVADCDEMLQLCAARNVRLGTIFNIRGHSQTRWIKRMIGEGSWTPRLVAVRAALSRYDSIAGVLLSGGVHYIDLMNWWLGLPSAVTCLTGDGVILATMTYPSLLGAFRLTGVGSTNYGVKVDIEAEEGRLTFGRHGLEAVDGDLGTPPAWDGESSGMAVGAGHATVIREAADAIAADRDFPVTGREGRDAVAICELVLRTAELPRRGTSSHAVR